MDYIKALTESQMKQDIPAFEIGDTVKVYVKVKEGNRVRAQMFEGTVISKNGGGGYSAPPTGRSALPAYPPVPPAVPWP